MVIACVHVYMYVFLLYMEFLNGMYNKFAQA